MKTLYKCNRVVKDDDTDIEEKLKACFFLEDVVQWERGEENVFNKTKETTHVDIRSGHAMYIDIKFDKFTDIMIEFIEKQGKINVQTQQN